MEKTKVTVEEQVQRLTGVVESLAGTVVAHDDQIGNLIKIAEKQAEQIAKQGEKIDKISEQIAQLTREWQAYLTTIRPQ
jgi:ABC-type transporter Mla subunit MlaD